MLSITDDVILELEEHFSLSLLIPNVSLAIGVQEGPLIFSTGRIFNDDGKLSLYSHVVVVYNSLCTLLLPKQ